MIDVLIETSIDTLKIIPFLFIIYLFLEFVQKKAGNYKFNAEKLNNWGPLFGGIAGCIPQCGFSASAAALYSEKIIKAGTLIAVFLATSDEAIPLLLSASGQLPKVGILILLKLIISVTAGYILNFTLFRNEKIQSEKQVDIDFDSCESHEHHEHKESFIKNAVHHTLKISLYILGTLLAINLIIFFIGEDRFSAILLSGNFFQPFVTALLGLIPGCSVSVLITQLFISGELTLGSAIAGLCTGAGFGFMILFRKTDIKNLLKIMGLTYFFAVISGIIIDLIL